MVIEGVVVREALSAGVEVLDGCRDAAADQLEATGDQSESVVGAVLREAGLPLGDAAKDRGGLSEAERIGKTVASPLNGGTYRSSA